MEITNADNSQHILTLGFNVGFIFIKGLKKYDQQVYDLIMELFDSLPLACLVNGRFLCLHGGISHDLKTINDIERIDRFR